MKHSKRIFRITLLIIIFSFFSLTGCPRQNKNGKNAENPQNENAAKVEVEVFTEKENGKKEIRTEAIIEIFEETGGGISTVGEKMGKGDTERYFAESIQNGYDLEKKGDLKAASLAYQLLTTEFPNRFEPYHRLARIYEQHKNKEDEEMAYVLYEEALRKRPSDAAFFNDYGWFLLSREQAAEALPILQQAVTLAPKEIKYKNNLALCLGKSRRYEEAFLMFKEASAGDSAVAYINLANIQISLGEFSEVKKSLQKALTHDPKSVPAKEMLREIEMWEEKQDAE